MANVPAPLGKMMDTVRGFTVAQRTIMIIGVAILVMGAVALSTFLSQPKMTPLFSGLAPEDAAGIVEQLKSDGVSYELSGGGGTVLYVGFLAWVAYGVSHLGWRAQLDVPRTVVSLIAGVSLLDALLIVGHGATGPAWAAVAGFLATLVLQRWVPGT